MSAWKAIDTVQPMKMRLNHCMLDHAITIVIMMQNTVDHEILLSV